MRGQIKTTGDLRDFLAKTMEDVAAGMIDNDKASRMVKLAAQITESFYAEIKTVKIRTELGEESFKLGLLPISSAQEG